MLGLLGFVGQARRLALTLGEIVQIAAQRRTGAAPCDLAITLCPNCEHCPEVVIEGDTISIGESPNLTVLKKDEWNVLVDLIQSGQIGRI